MRVPFKKDAGSMGHSVMSSRVLQDQGLVKTAATSLQPFGQIACTGHVVRCLAGALTRVAWQGQPATAAAMVIVGSGNGLVITATKQY